MVIVEDTRQQAGKHDLKHEWFSQHGISLVRNKLPFGDYSLVPSIAVDTKKDMDEIAANICGREHTRFINECKAAKAAGCALVVLVENTVDIYELAEVHNWVNPRSVYSDKCVQGPRLQKAMETISERYGVTFLFCRPEKAAEKIMEILKWGTV